MRTISIIVLVLIAFTAKAQSLEDVVRLRNNSVVIASDDSLEWIAKENARHIIIAFNEDNPDDLQNVIDNIESGWFVDMDVFLGDDLDSVIAHIKDTAHTAFDVHPGKILVNVSETYDLCLVTVYCLPND